MTQKVLGPTGSPRRRWTVLLPLTLALVLGLFYVAGAQAVHDENIFELGSSSATVGSADILGDDSAANGPDWGFVAGTSDDGLFNSAGALQAGLQGGLAAAFIADQSSAGGALDDTTFSGGGTSNKNTDAISTADCANRTPPLTGSDCAPWVWDAGNVPAKDDLTNVYAWEKLVDPCNLTQPGPAGCTPTASQSDDHLILYAGVEREDPSGSSHVDIEFLQDSVALDEAPKCNDPGADTTPCHFNGLRTEDDVIVSMDFNTGGTIGSVTIRSWDGDTYVLEGTAGGEGCFSNDQICAFNNGDDIDGGPWPNLDNHGDEITNLEANAFTEIGADLTALIGASPCLSTMMGKTRSSASFTSELKDFAGPHTFAVCAPSTSLTATTSPSPAKIASGGSVTLTFSEDNDGNEGLVSANVLTNNAGCSPTKSSGDTDNDNILDTTETWVFTCTMTNLTTDVTVVAWGVGTGELSGKLVTGNPTCTPSASVICSSAERTSTSIDVIHPATRLLKKAQVSITYTFYEKNTGDDPISSVSVTDDKCSPSAVLSGSNNVGDTNTNNLLDPGEIWKFSCTASSTEGSDYDVTNVGTGHGNDSLGNAVPSTNESDTVRVQVTHTAPNVFP